MTSQRAIIAKNFDQVNPLRKLLGIPLIYLPILLIPFVAVSALITYAHLLLIGSKNIKKYRDFIPDWSSYRYTIKTQIVEASWQNPLSKFRLYWYFNCSFYCPLSIGLFSWHTYLVKIVENWWCPFSHDKKSTYKDASIDKSFWHLNPRMAAKLDPEDRNNPIWNEDAQPKHDKNHH